MAWITMSFDSEALHMPVMLDVLLPQGHGNYKSLYLLHGAGGDHSSWITKTRISDYADNTDIAVIMPSGNNKCYFTFITEELIKKCEMWFSLSTKKEDRFIAGMSMGGYGAVNAALECPDKYGAVFSYSGLMDIVERFNNPRGIDFTPVFGNESQLLTGNYDLMEKVHKYHDRFSENVEKQTKFYIYCGLSDRILHMSDKMYMNMKDNGFNVKYQAEEGSHDWEYWDKCISKTVDIINNSTVNQGGKTSCQ
ncbi:MAG: alpha/beta hydrolase-fold protein [Eubacteriales bacterium]|nr:alpha/beta hydrolase-fold protein [Eubacteriales bacterium]